MALSMEEDATLTEILADLEPEIDKMKPGFQQNFTRDQIERHRKYGSNIFMSPKQWSVLRQLHDEYVGSGNNAPDDEDGGY